MVMGRLVEPDLGPDRGTRQCTSTRERAYFAAPNTNLALSLRSMVNGVMTCTPRLMQASGILIFFLDPAATSWVTTVWPSMVLMINAVVKRLLVRAACVR